MMNALEMEPDKCVVTAGQCVNHLPEESRPITRNGDAIYSLLRPTLTVTEKTRAKELAEMFKYDASLRIIPVLDADNKPVGAVHRNHFMAIFLSQFGHDLYGRKPIERLMCRDPLILEKDVTLQQASRIITDSSLMRDAHDFIITDGGRFIGAGFLLDLLKKITELQVTYARYANPLTMLPGNVPICEEIDACLEAQTPFTVCYFDLDNFKPFNDVYGYELGDRVIQKVAEVLTEHVDSRCDFIGHVGGDDFIVIFRSEDWHERTTAMLKVFERHAPLWYAPKDRDEGGITSQDRRGQTHFFGFVSLSVGAVKPLQGGCKSHHDVASLAAHAKKMAKQTLGNSLFIDRRHSVI
ncbi:GGDEF domain-containing protein [Magnetococcus sp. PR-3]|uniref:GGDEF domain-containing protein n=1 Tax=Magnetococcus sp. PR-3 TaxID=3120355 RepID=UPI002FCE0346